MVSMEEKDGENQREWKSGDTYFLDNSSIAILASRTNISVLH
jgi:hypothetical protein